MRDDQTADSHVVFSHVGSSLSLIDRPVRGKGKLYKLIERQNMHKTQHQKLRPASDSRNCFLRAN